MRRRRTLAALAGLAALLVGGATFIGYPFGEVLSAPPLPAPVPQAGDGAVILLSGDGGAHTGMAPAVAADLRDRGIPVVLVSSLAYFAKTRSDPEIADLLRSAMSRARQVYGAERFVMIGQSFGADVLPTGLGQLSPIERARVAGAILVVPSTTYEHRATPFGLLNTSPALPSLPAANRLDWLPLACIHGIEEKDSACPQLAVRGVVTQALPGGHYMHHDDAAVSAALLPIITADLTKVSSAEHGPASARGAQAVHS